MLIAQYSTVIIRRRGSVPWRSDAEALENKVVRSIFRWQLKKSHPIFIDFLITVVLWLEVRSALATARKRLDKICNVLRITSFMEIPWMG